MQIDIKLKKLIFFTLITILSFCVVCKAEVAQNIDVQNAREIISFVQILDVRTPEEFKAGHIDGAINIDVNSEGFNNMVAELEREKTYLVHCTANVLGGRATKAIHQLKSLGFSSIKNLEGGYLAWIKSGGEIVKE